MRMPRARLTVRWLVVSVGILAMLVAIERWERLRSGIALSRAEMPYRSAKWRATRRGAVKEYAERILRRELAAVEDEVKRAEDQLKKKSQTRTFEMRSQAPAFGRSQVTPDRAQLTFSGCSIARISLQEKTTVTTLLFIASGPFCRNRQCAFSPPRCKCKNGEVRLSV